MKVRSRKEAATFKKTSTGLEIEEVFKDRGEVGMLQVQSLVEKLS